MHAKKTLKIYMQLAYLTGLLYQYLTHAQNHITRPVASLHAKVLPIPRSCYVCFSADNYMVLSKNESLDIY